MYDRGGSAKSPTLTHSPTLYGDAVSANLQVHIEALARRAFGSSHPDSRLSHDDCAQAGLMDDGGMHFLSGVPIGIGIAAPGGPLQGRDKMSARPDSPSINEHRYKFIFSNNK